MPAVLDNLVTAAMTVTAAALTVIALRAWLYTRSPKILLVALAFCTFLLKGLMLSAGLFLTPAWGQNLLPVSIALDVVILVLFYFAVLKRSQR
jgi:hypothetical protein